MKGFLMDARVKPAHDTSKTTRARVTRLHSAAVPDILPGRGAAIGSGRKILMIQRLLPVLAMLAGLLAACSAASAHPHVWVTVKSELVYAPDGSVTGVRHAWTFDDMFSTFAIQGVEAKKKGQYTRQELAPLAQVNVDSLKEYDFFTYAKANGNTVAFSEPSADYYLEYDPKETMLTLFFTLPLKTPVKAKELTVEVYDREFFVDFSFAEKNPAKLVGAPAHCKLSVVTPETMSADLSARLSALAADQRDPTLTIGSEFANKLVVKCP
jgi:ABC-type uncharacterized transport system substrate-binding protein